MEALILSREERDVLVDDDYFMQFGLAGGGEPNISTPEALADLRKWVDLAAHFRAIVGWGEATEDTYPVPDDLAARLLPYLKHQIGQVEDTLYHDEKSLRGAESGDPQFYSVEHDDPVAARQATIDSSRKLIEEDRRMLGVLRDVVGRIGAVDDDADGDLTLTLAVPAEFVPNFVGLLVQPLAVSVFEEWDRDSWDWGLEDLNRAQETLAGFAERVARLLETGEVTASVDELKRWASSLTEGGQGIYTDDPAERHARLREASACVWLYDEIARLRAEATR